MNIGLITDNYSCYNRNYPLLRGTHVLLKELKNLGHSINQVFPYFSRKAVDNSNLNYLFEEPKLKYFEWIQDKTVKINNFATTEEIKDYVKKLDAIFISHLPWNESYYFFRRELNPFLKWLFEETNIPIIVHDCDNILDNEKRKKYITDFYEKLDWKKRISLFCTYYYPTEEVKFKLKDYNYVYMPFCYDQDFELSIEEQPTNYGLHFGPIAYRTKVFEFYNKFLNESDRRLKIYGLDKLGNYYRDLKLDSKLIDKYPNQIDIEPESFHSDFKSYLTEFKKSDFCIHDSGVQYYSKTNSQPHTVRLFEGAYSGILTQTIKFNDISNDEIKDNYLDYEDINYLLCNKKQIVQKQRQFLSNKFNIKEEIKKLKGFLL